MKILDRYILTTYLKTFLSVFVILMFIFVLQTIWLYISELAGKSLDIVVVGKFLMYFAPKMIPLVLPLTILLASIMVFGNFAENYEFAAMKSTGISLQRAMRSLSVFIFGLSILAFFFANNVIPWAEYESYNLRRNIAKVKPAMAIAEGQFNEIGNINIKVKELSGDRDQYLKDVVIHQKKAIKRGNYTVIKAENGELISSEESNVLQLELKNGNYYDEIINKDTRKYINNNPHAQSKFEKYTINVDLAGLNNIDLEEKSSDSRYSMLDIVDLNYTIDSLYEKENKDYETLSKTLYNRSTYNALSTNYELKNDSLYKGDDVLSLFTNKVKVQILNLALTSAKSASQILESNSKTFQVKDTWRNKHIIALHEKYVLGFACIILFFVGAPLGALIRKGGLGLPMVIAILLFLTYHFLGIFAKNSSKDGTLDPVIATWLSTLVMLPLGIYLTSRATKDRGLFEMDIIMVPLKKLFSFRSNEKLEGIKSVQSYSYYNKHTVDELIEIVKEQSEFDINKQPKKIALQHLSDKKVSLKELESKGLEVPGNIKGSKRTLNKYNTFSKISLIGFSIGAISLILHFVFKNNKFPELAATSIGLSIISFSIFFLTVVFSSMLCSKFYKFLYQKKKRINPLVFILSLPFYPIKHFLLKNKMEQDFHLSCLENIK